MSNAPPTHRPPTPPTLSWPHLVAVALVLTIAGQAIPFFTISQLHDHLLPVYVRLYKYDVDVSPTGGRVHAVLLIAMGLLLTLTTPRRSGLIVGRIKGVWWRALLIAAVPITLTAIIYPRLPSRPFEGRGEWIWQLGPLAEELLFTGFLYGHFAQRGEARLHPRVPINAALLVMAAFFSLWHASNFLTAMPAGYVLFQMAYVFVLSVWTGMTRVLTGSLIYAIIVHMTINYIAVHPW